MSRSESPSASTHYPPICEYCGCFIETDDPVCPADAVEDAASHRGLAVLGEVGRPEGDEYAVDLVGKVDRRVRVEDVADDRREHERREDDNDFHDHLGISEHLELLG